MSEIWVTKHLLPEKQAVCEMTFSRLKVDYFVHRVPAKRFGYILEPPKHKCMDFLFLSRFQIGCIYCIHNSEDFATLRMGFYLLE